jgi:cytochrome d ubiquinol oxidase subunit I
MGAWQAGAFFVISVAAFYLLRRQHEHFAKTSMKVAFVVAMGASLLQLVSGHDSAVTVAEHQPAKLAAFEGVYETGPDQPLAIMGWVDEANQEVVGIEIPGMLSWLVGYDTGTVVQGLNDFPEEDRPPVQITFQTYHVMVAIGMTLILLAWVGGIMAWRDQLVRHRWMLWILVFSVLLPQAAGQLGWAAAEIGRQPWIVYGLMRTAEGVSQTVPASNVLFSLILFTLIYIALFVVFIVLLDQKIKHGPLDEDMPRTGEIRS